MARPEQVLLLEPQHELKFRGKRGGPGLEGKGGAASVSRVRRGGGGAGQCFVNQTRKKANFIS